MGRYPNVMPGAAPRGAKGVFRPTVGGVPQPRWYALCNTHQTSSGEPWCRTDGPYAWRADAEAQLDKEHGECLATEQVPD